MKYDYLIVGAGFAGSVLAERIANILNKKVLLVEKRNHIGGNAFDEFDEHGILIHRYGPHIFHTNSKRVFDYLSQFTDWNHYEHKVLANLNGELYPLPVNRITINKFYNLNLKTEKDVQNFLEKIREKRHPVLNSEDVIINKVGYEIFEKFFKTYTKKQWHLEPKELSPLVCGRIPVLFNDDCRIFPDKYQFMPKDGYTKMFQNMLSNENINIVLNKDYKEIISGINFEKIIYTGPVDYFFDYKFGRLPYRSIRFKFENYPVEKYQEAAQINFVGDEEFTRVVEYKQMTFQKSKSTTLSREFPVKEGEPYYPVPTEKNRELYMKYKAEAKKLKNVIFCGRLAEYQYYNMDQVVAGSLKVFEDKIK